LPQRAKAYVIACIQNEMDAEKKRQAEMKSKMSKGKGRRK